MHSSLRTLLAYEDSLFDTATRRDWERHASPHDVTGTLQRLRAVRQETRLGVPTDDDPNLVAEYLDHVSDPRATLELEHRCATSDILLAEVAACHQIVTRHLGEEVVIDHANRLRCYQTTGKIVETEKPNRAAPSQNTNQHDSTVRQCLQQQKRKQKILVWLAATSAIFLICAITASLVFDTSPKQEDTFALSPEISEMPLPLSVTPPPEVVVNAVVDDAPKFVAMEIPPAPIPEPEPLVLDTFVSDDISPPPPEIILPEPQPVTPPAPPRRENPLRATSAPRPPQTSFVLPPAVHVAWDGSEPNENTVELASAFEFEPTQSARSTSLLMQREGDTPPPPRPTAVFSAAQSPPKEPLAQNATVSHSALVFLASTPDSPWVPIRHKTIVPLESGAYLLTASPFHAEVQLSNRIYVRLVGDAKVRFVDDIVEIDYGRVVISRSQRPSPPIPLRIVTPRGSGVVEIPVGAGIIFVDTFAGEIPRRDEVIGFLTEPNALPITWQHDSATPFDKATTIPIHNSVVVILGGENKLASLSHTPSWIAPPLPRSSPLEQMFLDAWDAAWKKSSGDIAETLTALTASSDPLVRSTAARLWGDLGHFETPLKMLAAKNTTANTTTSIHESDAKVAAILGVYFREVRRRDAETLTRLNDAVQATTASTAQSQ